MAEHEGNLKESAHDPKGLLSTVENDTEPFREAYTKLIECRYKDCEDAMEYCDKFAKYMREVEVIHKKLIPRFQKHNLFILGLGPAGEKKFQTWIKEKRSEPQSNSLEELIDDFKNHVAERKAREEKERKHREEKQAAKPHAKRQRTRGKSMASADEPKDSQSQ